MKLKDDELVSRFLRTDGTRPTAKEVRRELMLAYNKGYDVVPPCDQVDERGHCRGHAPDSR
jgi:hypothetical protein